MNFKIAQSSTQDSQEKKYWNWSVWIEAHEEDLNKIKEVEYILHPTFRNNIRSIKSRRTKFKLSSKGWGEFKIHARIYLKDQEDPLYLSHYLKLFSEDQEDQSESIFVSAPLRSKEEVTKLTEELKEDNVVVHSQDDIDPEGNLISSLSNLISDADAFVLFNSGEISVNQKFELGLAKSANKNIFIIDSEGNKTQYTDEAVFRSSEEMLNSVKKAKKGAPRFKALKKR